MLLMGWQTKQLTLENLQQDIFKLDTLEPRNSATWYMGFLSLLFVGIVDLTLIFRTCRSQEEVQNLLCISKKELKILNLRLAWEL